MKPVGYLANSEGGLAGEPGLFYNYITAGNGLFVRAESQLLRATVHIAGAMVRGLRPLEETVELPKGRIPRHIHDLALSIFFADRYRDYREHYLAVTWEGEYHLRDPSQDATTASVNYERLPSTVLDIHSHGTIKAFFSMQDNRDEQGLRLYIVVGRLDTLIPEMEMRVGVYGYFAPLSFEDVFDV